jgi:hypothetical protein
MDLVLLLSRIQLAVSRVIWPNAIYPEPMPPGKKYRSIKRPKVYEALRRKGKSKTVAAKISNAMAGRRKKKR